MKKIKILTLLSSSLLLASCASVKDESHQISTAQEAFKPSVTIFEAEAEKYLSPNAKIETLASGHIWTEGPVWVPDAGYLLYSDIPNNKIMKFQPGKGAELYLNKSGATGLFEGDHDQGSNALLINSKGQLVLLQQGDRRVAIMDSDLDKPKSKFITLAGNLNGKRLNSPNDAVYHSDGSLYFTDPAYGLKERLNDPRKELAFQGLFRINPAGKLELLDDSINFPNGIALSKDEKTLYVAVSDEEFPRWLAYQVESDGSISNKRLLIDATDDVKVKGEIGMPDGMALHSSGNLFATGPGGVWLITPEGKVLAKIYTGKLTANCTLSADEKTLYLTAHDTLMSVALK
ncbi:SMP-30/gluconolactonase/LRE family protein [Catenovulum maritimum]|uniref:Gluconolactonase n=1 Tax=Catenovulum maritimum TaxID=1513271 RepID=A0A0J8JQ43_9ALTE|nr:SMP-30/gluconolactonase/LRE family protein [Catenovulum maritimum]KMT66826.1 gluconolactonase [Catenovulum maritimum]